MVDGNFMLMLTYRFVTIQGFDRFEPNSFFFLVFFWFREKLRMAYHSLALNVLFYEGRFITSAVNLLLNKILAAETFLHSFEMYHPMFHRRMVLRSKFAYEHIVCSMSLLQKISCGSTALRKRWRRMPIRYRNETLCVGNG